MPGSGNIAIKHDFSAVTKKIVVLIYEVSNLAAEVQPRQVINAPHIAGAVTTFNNLRLVMHYVQFWESTDGVILEELRHDWNFQATRSQSAFQVFEYIVDRNSNGVNPNWSDPISGQSSVVDERYADADEVKILREGGSLNQVGVNVNLMAGGGFELLNGDKFDPNEKWTAMASWNVAAVETGGDASSGVDIHEVAVDDDFDSDFFFKDNIAASAGGIMFLDFPAFATIPSGTWAKFLTHTGEQTYWVLRFTGGNTVRYKGKDRNIIYLGKSEWIKLFWKVNNVGDVVCYALDDDTGYDRIGVRELVDQWDLVDGNNGNRILLDGTKYLIVDQPRLTEFVQGLPPGQIKTEAEWAATEANKHFYAIDNVAQTIRVPDDRNMHYRALKTNDGVNGQSGAYTPDQLLTHEHEQTVGQLPGSIFGRGLLLRVGNGQYGSSGTTKSDLTGPPVKSDGSEVSNGDENNVRAVRQYAIVNI